MLTYKPTNMTQAIILNFPPGIAGETRHRFTEDVNFKLQPIAHEVNSWNAFIELRQRDNEYQLVAICDDDDLREKMQRLLTA